MASVQVLLARVDNLDDLAARLAKVSAHVSRQKKKKHPHHLDSNSISLGLAQRNKRVCWTKESLAGPTATPADITLHGQNCSRYIITLSFIVPLLVAQVGLYSSTMELAYYTGLSCTSAPLFCSAWNVPKTR